jgi:putative ABC transport system permease protein
VLQFSISIGLIIATFIVNHQLNYLKHKKLGFRKEHTIIIPLENEIIMKKYSYLKNEFMKNSNVISITGASNVISSFYSTSPFWWEGAQGNESLRLHKIFVDHNFVKTFGMEMIQGKNFSQAFAVEGRSAYILNESAVKFLGWKNPIGKMMARAHRKEDKKTVIGVIKDFHFRSLHEKIAPLILCSGGTQFRVMYVQIHTHAVASTVASLHNTWEEIIPERPFEYSFLDNEINQMYKSEENIGQIVSYTSLLAILIACLGLYGLASFTTQQRTKEIGIRRVLGASVSYVVLLLSREFLKFVLIANVIAWPLSYFVLQRWLTNFAYRAGISMWLFLLAGISALAIAILTVSYQSIKTALANPVDSLRYE